MGTPAEQSARKKRKEEAERRRLKELGILPEGGVPGQERGTAPPEDPMSNIDEIAASEAPYDDGYVEPDPSDFVNPLTESGTDPAVLPTEEEIEDRHSKAKSDALAEGRKEFYDLTGETVEGAKFDMPGAAEKRKEEDALEQKTFEEGREEFHAETQGILEKDQADHEERLKNPSHPGYVNPKDARHIEELEYREDRLRQLGSGMSQGEIAAANNPMLQQAIADKAAREAAKPTVEERVARGSKQAQDKDRALEKAGYTVNRKFTPTFINPDTGKEEGGDPYDPSLREYIPITDEETGEVTGQILHEIPGARDKRRVSEEAQGKVRMKFGEEVAADDPSSANDTFVSRTQADKQVAARERRIREAAEQKDERKRRGMLLRGDTHALGELDRQTAEDAATRLRDAEAAIRADETLTANEQAIKIQELKNTGVTDVAQIGADAQTGVATTQAGAAMHASDAGVEIAAGQNQSAETINAATLAAQAASQESQQEFNLELTSLNNQQQTDFQAAQNAHAASEAGMDRDQQALLLTMTQDFQAGESNLNREQETRLEELRQLHAIEGATLNHQQQRELLNLTHAATAEARESQEAHEAGLVESAEQKQARREQEAQDQAILAAPPGTYTPEQVTAATERRDARIQGSSPPPAEGESPEGFDSLTPRESESHLSQTDPELHSRVVDLADDYIDDYDDPVWGDSSSEHFMSLANELRKDIAAENITADNLQYVAKMLTNRMDPKVREDFEKYSAQYESGALEDEMFANKADSISYLMEIFAGRFPINTDPTTGKPVQTSTRTETPLGTHPVIPTGY